MKTIELTQGKQAIVDDSDYEYLMQWKWHYAHGYAVRGVRKNGKVTIVLMHRVILGAKTGEQVDHINHDRLDNQRSNIRVCTHEQNQHNRSLNRNNTSGYKGVHWNKDCKKWLASIKVSYKRIHLGCFTDIILAAKTYDSAAKKHFGEYACTNF